LDLSEKMRIRIESEAPRKARFRSLRQESEVKHVRYGAWGLAALLLAYVSTGQAQIVETNAQDRPDLAAADWKKNLKIGPNGPIPVVVVDQFGYLPKSRKVAVIRAPQVGYDSFATFPPGKSYALIELPTGKVVKMASPTIWNWGNTDQALGDKAWWFDFSEIEVRGKYAVADLEKGIRSPDFSIGEHVYKDVMKPRIFLSAWGGGSRRNRRLQVEPGRTRRAAVEPGASMARLPYGKIYL
jgi:Cellulase N-terminal ig-like domain